MNSSAKSTLRLATAAKEGPRRKAKGDREIATAAMAGFAKVAVWMNLLSAQFQLHVHGMLFTDCLDP